MWNIYTYGETPFQGKHPNLNIPTLVESLTRELEQVLHYHLVIKNERPNTQCLVAEYDPSFHDIIRIIEKAWSSEPDNRGLISEHADALM